MLLVLPDDVFPGSDCGCSEYAGGLVGSVCGADAEVAPVDDASNQH